MAIHLIKQDQSKNKQSPLLVYRIVTLTRAKASMSSDWEE